MTGVVTGGRGRKLYSFLDEISTSIQAMSYYVAGI